MKKRDDRALGRVASHAPPGTKIVGEQQQDSDHRKPDFAKIRCLLQECIKTLRKLDNALLEGHGKTHALAGGEGALGAERRFRVRIAGNGHRLFGCAGNPGIGREFEINAPSGKVTRATDFRIGKSQ